ncbi:MAG: copper resistance protein CopC/CopD [Streptomyces sp.]|nr:copper resistance protein CopC/CopD [Streptomyces sp.]
MAASPADGAQLESVPKTVELTFSEAVDPHGVLVTAGGTRLKAGVPAGRPSHVVAAVSAGGVKPSHGRLTLAWRVVDEEDGHASSGSVGYRIDAAASAGAASPAAPSAARSPAAVKDALTTVRWVGYLSLALFVGGLAFVAALWPQGTSDRRTRVVLVLSWAAGLLATVAQAGLQGAYARLGTLGDAFTSAAYSEVLGSEVGIVLAARALLWVLAAIVLAAALQGGRRAARSPGWRVGAAAVGFGLLRATGMSGHNSEGTHPVWGEVADLVHLAGVSLWIGGLVLLVVGVLPRRNADELAVVVPRYSILALTSVTSIAGAGSVLAWQVVGSVHGLLHTSYGHKLMVKVAVLAVVLSVAQRSRTWVRHRLDLAVLLRGDAATVRPLIRSVAVEACLVLAVLAAASVLVMADPGR